MCFPVLEFTLDVCSLAFLSGAGGVELLDISSALIYLPIRQLCRMDFSPCGYQNLLFNVGAGIFCCNKQRRRYNCIWKMSDLSEREIVYDRDRTETD